MNGSPNIYVLDAPRAREWSRMLGHFEQCSWHSGRRIPLTQDDQEPTAGILVVHAGYVEGVFQPLIDQGALARPAGLRVREALSETLDKHPNLICIVISGADSTQGVVVPHRLYYRRAAVRAPYDPAFKKLFAEFVEAVRQGKVDFELLDPRPFPDELVAVYLMALALSDGGRELDGIADEIFRDAQRWRTAQLQFAERLAAQGVVGSSGDDQVAAFSGDWPQAVFEHEKPKAGFLEKLKTALQIGNPAQAGAGK